MYKFSNDLNLSLYENENKRVFLNRCTHLNAIKHVIIQLQNRIKPCRRLLLCIDYYIHHSDSTQLTDKFFTISLNNHEIFNNNIKFGIGFVFARKIVFVLLMSYAVHTISLIPSFWQYIN